LILLFKLFTVPLFIGILTLLEKKFGARIVGLLGGFPIIAGPILTFLAIDNGSQFAILAATSAISAIICLLGFGVTYCWLSKNIRGQLPTLYRF